MKFLRVFSFVFLATLSIFATFSIPEKVFAQTSRCDGLSEVQRNACLGIQSQTDQTPSGGTYDYFYNQAISIFNAGTNGLKNVLTAQEGNRSDKNRATNIEGTTAYLGAVADMQRSYISSFNQSKSSSVLPVKAQQDALRAAMSTYETFLSGLGLKADYSSDARAVMNTMLARTGGLQGLISQAEQIQAGTIAAGSDRANLLGNADAVTRVAQGRADNAGNTSKCSFGIVGTMDLGACISEGVSWIIKNTLLELAGFLVWLTANMFNYAVQIGILQFSQWAPDTLYPIWIIVRQIISLLIVFMGLYLGFLYILGDPKGRFEKYLPWVVIFGLFVNFSYPLARTAIDISNIVSLNIYASTVGGDALTAGPGSPSTAGALIMNKLGLQGLVASATKDSSTGILGGAINSIPGSLMAVIFVFYAAYIFFMVTAIIAMRTAALVFITIASPLLLVDSVLPLLGEQAQRLRKIFLEQLAVGPVFMIMLALTLKFLDVFKVGLNSISNPNSTSVTISTFFNLLMMLIMLHIMITITRKVAGEVGNYATQAIGRVGGFGLGVATGGVGLLARKGIGGLALKARESGWVNKQGSFAARRAYDMSNALANSTFDIRKSSVIAGGMQKAGFDKGLLGMGGMGGTSAAKLGYEQESEARTKNIATRGARIKTRYERDIYEKDSSGNTVLKHKKGDIDEEGVKAKTDYAQTRGGALFLSKAEKDRLDDTFVDTQSAESLAKYKTMKDKKDANGKSEKDYFVDTLTANLEELKKTDKKIEGAETKSLMRTLETIKKEKKEQAEAFDAQVEDAFYKYSVKTNPADKEKFLTSQSKEIQEDIRSRTDNLKSTTLAPRPTQSTSIKLQPEQKPEAVSVSSPATKVADTNWEASNVPAVNRKESSSIEPTISEEPVTFTQRMAAKRAAGAAGARQSMGEIPLVQTSPAAVKPEFLKSAEEKINENKEVKKMTPPPTPPTEEISSVAPVVPKNLNPSSSTKTPTEEELTV